MAKRGETGAAIMRVRRLDPKALAQTREPTSKIVDVERTAIPIDEQSIGPSITLVDTSFLKITAQGRNNSRMDRHNPRFMELRLQDLKVGVGIAEAHVGHGQTTRFAYADPRCFRANQALLTARLVETVHASLTVSPSLSESSSPRRRTHTAAAADLWR